MNMANDSLTLSQCFYTSEFAEGLKEIKAHHSEKDVFELITQPPPAYVTYCM